MATNIDDYDLDGTSALLLRSAVKRCSHVFYAVTYFTLFFNASESNLLFSFKSCKNCNSKPADVAKTKPVLLVILSFSAKTPLSKLCKTQLMVSIYIYIYIQPDTRIVIEGFGVKNAFKFIYYSYSYQTHEWPRILTVMT